MTTGAFTSRFLAFQYPDFRRRQYLSGFAAAYNAP